MLAPSSIWQGKAWKTFLKMSWTCSSNVKFEITVLRLEDHFLCKWNLTGRWHVMEICLLNWFVPVNNLYPFSIRRNIAENPCVLFVFQFSLELDILKSCTTHMACDSCNFIHVIPYLMYFLTLKDHISLNIQRTSLFYPRLDSPCNSASLVERTAWSHH